MTILYSEFIDGEFITKRDRVVVLDIGGSNVNRSYSAIFADPKISYLTAHSSPSEGVDNVLQGLYRITRPDGSVDIVISGQMVQHCEFFWLAFKEMVRVLKDDGFLFLIAPSSGTLTAIPSTATASIRIPTRPSPGTRTATSRNFGATSGDLGTIWLVCSASICPLQRDEQLADGRSYFPWRYLAGRSG